MGQEEVGDVGNSRSFSTCDSQAIFNVSFGAFLLVDCRSHLLELAVSSYAPLAPQPYFNDTVSWLIYLGFPGKRVSRVRRQILE
jgi:hypothetical protein